ncbi:HlyD family secretion protein [Niabella sp. CJ426]|uniref:HlyD family secretion protein n=1 Tax=Niabella sp. CJ426 TaxID=3393740 RepID=UPI003D069879
MSDTLLPVEQQQSDEQKFAGERTEEVQDIIDRMPTRFGYFVAGIIILMLLLMVLFGFTIRYPDVITGSVTINTATAPVKLVANTSGKLILNIRHSLDTVQEGDVIAYIESPVSIESIKKVRQLLDRHDPNILGDRISTGEFPNTIVLGALTTKYYYFLNSVSQLRNFLDGGLYNKRVESLKQLVAQQSKESENMKERVATTEANIGIVKKLYGRDSLLFKDKVLSEADLEKSNLSYLGSKTNLNGMISEQLRGEKEQVQVKSQITEAQIQGVEKYKELKLAVFNAFNDLKDNIKAWEQMYTIKAPFGGQVQFLKFWQTGQYVQTAEPVFTIIPNNEEPYGQVVIPALGAGKVKLSQEVILKLNNFPYTEFGVVKGRVAGISKTTSIEKTPQGEVETYLVSVKLDNGFMTNYGKTLSFTYEAKGSAEIIANDRKLIERFFDNLRYATNR